MDRKTAILLSANEHFASHGYRGASLRDIARDAKVSLTLLNHHFGSKLDLLRAVMHAHRQVLERCVQDVRAMLVPGSPPPRMEAVIGAWLDVVQDVATTRDGRFFLRLLARMVDDPQAEASMVVRDNIEAAAQVMMDAICAAWPGTPRRKAAVAYLVITTGMLKAATAAERLAQLEGLGAEPASAPAAVREPALVAESGGGDDGGAGVALVSPPLAEAESTAPPPEREYLLRFMVGGLEALVGS